ncbi:permease [Nitratifractor sp.]|uniref:permease n=1 Tax=Nitratifractor sp. TaxID=2268144 RepID=UPI0025D438A9|nr:permease [Nitratifractor sp.]
MNGEKSYRRELKKAAIGIIAILPMMLGIVGLVGIFRAFVSREMLAAVFTGNVVSDTLAGTVAGMIAVGQAIVSYILGGELLEQGISLYAVAAFVLSWVTLGVVQLPLEAEVLGLRFTILRNTLAFVFTILTAVAAVWSAQWLQ